MRSKNASSWGRAGAICAVGLSAAALLTTPVSAKKKIDVTKEPAKEAPAAAGDSKSTVARGINAFTFDFFGAIRTSEPGNLFLSPYSISTALSMTTAGARGNTRDELNRALHFSELQPDAVNTAMGGLIGDFNATTHDGKPRGFQLAVANRLFGAKGAQFQPAFLSVNADLYKAPIEQMDFANATEASRVAINKWVESKTNSKVRDLIAQGQLLSSAKLVLVNALYFHADWAQPFIKPATQPTPFAVETGPKVSVPMMRREGKFGYFEEPGKLQVVELPYSGGELSMLVLLPAQGEKLATLEARLSADNLQKWSSEISQRPVDVFLPKFKVTWGTKDVVPQLKKLGVKDAFVFPQADFSGIDGGKTLIISLVLHKAFVDVNEEGTEAAAATAVVMAPGGAPPKQEPPKVFKADRPFLFLIRDNASGTILFVGRIANPNQTEPPAK